jgi:iron complex transport system substrate-binding protein
MIRNLLILFVFILLAGCQWKGQNEKNPLDQNISNAAHVKYAKGFIINRRDNINEITVINPWQKAFQVEYTYLLSNSFTSSRIISDFKCMIRTPVRHVVCLSTTHIGFIDLLGEIESVSGISGKNYVVNEKLVEKISKNILPDVGYDENLNYEVLIKLRPDVVFAYGVSGVIANTIRKLNELGIPVVLVAEYLEEEPLAKTEWIKFFSLFYQKEKEAFQVFDSISISYQRLSRLAVNAGNKPEVIMGLPWHGVWYVSGGGSYIAKLINDAGGITWIIKTVNRFLLKRYLNMHSRLISGLIQEMLHQKMISCQSIKGLAFFHHLQMITFIIIIIYLALPGEMLSLNQV